MAINQKKTFEIVNANPKGRRIRSINVGGRTVKFKKNGTARVDDPGVAAEIEKRYGWKAKGADGGQVIVCPLEQYNEDRDRRPGANVIYHTIPALPWHQYDADGRRIKEQDHA